MIVMKPLYLFLSIILLIAARGKSSAAGIVWTNTAGGNWNAAANWNPNQLPGVSDTAIITNDGTYTVTVNISPTIASLVLGGNSGTQTASQASGSLNVTLGTINNHGLLNFAGTLNSPNLTVGGVMNWTSGTIGIGALNVASNGILNISGAVAKSINGALTNAGTVNWSGANITFSGGILHNGSGALLDSQGDVTLGAYSPSIFINQGVFRKSSGTGTTTIGGNISFINSGTVDAQVGTISLGGIAIGNGSVFIGAGTNWLNGSSYPSLAGSFSSQNLVFDGATLGGAGTLESGTMAWLSGTISSGTFFSVGSNATLNVSGSGSKNINGSLTNAGTVNWSGATIYFNIGILHNGPGALLDSQGDVTLGAYSPSIFINQGVFRKSGGTGATTIAGSSGISFINSGTVDAHVGTISLGDIAIGNGSVFIGAGTNRLSGSSSPSLAGSFNSQNLVLDGATLGGTGTLESGTMAWLSGAIGSGTFFSVGSNATLNVSGSGLKNISGTLTNAGLVNWSGANINFAGGGTLQNASGAVFDAQGDAYISQISPPATIINQGIVRKSAGSGTTTIGISFLNDGLVEGRSGTLLLGTTLANPVGSIAVAGGKVQSTQPLIVPVGSITGFGTIQAPSITVGGVVRPGATNNILTLSGNYIQSIGGSMEFDIGGTSPGTNQSQVKVIGAATLDGTIGLRFSDGYSPAVGSSNVVLTASSRRGQFRFQNYFFLLGQNKRMVPIYNPGNVVLSTISSPDPTGPSLTAGVSGQTFAVAWPSEFIGYGLYTKTNLTDAAWTLIPGVTNLYVENPMNSDRKFFQLIHN